MRELANSKCGLEIYGYLFIVSDKRSAFPYCLRGWRLQGIDSVNLEAIWLAGLAGIEKDRATWGEREEGRKKKRWGGRDRNKERC